MSRACKVFGHKVDGCACGRKKCDAEFHEWSRCRCSKCKRVNAALHQWDGCECSQCRAVRPEGHRVVCGKCVVCGLRPMADGARISGANRHEFTDMDGLKTRAAVDATHTWEHCRCRECGERRDAGHKDRCGRCVNCGREVYNQAWLESHVWDRCRCTACAARRNDRGHDYVCGTCSICGGKERGEGHDLDGCKCRLCDYHLASFDDGHDWEDCKCRTCGETRWQEEREDGGHDWRGCQCARCGKTQRLGMYGDSDRHTWDVCRCTQCGQALPTGYPRVHDWHGCACRRCKQSGNHDWRVVSEGPRLLDYDGTGYYREVLAECTRCGETKRDSSFAGLVNPGNT